MADSFFSKAKDRVLLVSLSATIAKYELSLIIRDLAKKWHIEESNDSWVLIICNGKKLKDKTGRLEVLHGLAHQTQKGVEKFTDTAIKVIKSIIHDMNI